MVQVEGSDKPPDEEVGQQEAKEKQTVAKKSKKARKKQKKKPGEVQNDHSKKIGRTKREFPQVSLEDALMIAQAIRQKNNGHPWDTALVANACGMGQRAPKFFYLASAARDYGLTAGSRDTPQISLTELGHDLVYATSPELEREKKIEAFFKIEKFKQVYDFYEGSNLPEHQYLSNALENQFHIAPSEHEDFIEVFKANCKYIGIENGLGGAGRSRADGSDAKMIETRSLGQPRGQFDRTAFVIMPFTEKGRMERSKGYFDEVLKSLITPAGNLAGFAIETARREDSDIIHHTIINQLLHADLVIADLTDHNPNVLLELGIRLAKEKPVVLIKSKDTGAIFDVDNLLRVYTYDQNLWTTTVQADVNALATRIEGTWHNRDQAVGYMRILTGGPQGLQVTAGNGQKV
jgi:nucleoside 2-deoxyribosyltransferase